MKHHCHANQCSVLTPPRLFMCIKHWNLVPLEMQKEVWAAYKGTTREDRLSSIRYMQACAQSVEHVANQEGKDPKNSYRVVANKLISTQQELM